MPIPTFDPQSQLPTIADLKLSASPFRETLETVAPGISNIVDNLQTTGESWWQTLGRILPSIEGTDEQRAYLEAQVKQAQQGLAPLPAPGTEDKKPDLYTIAKWGVLGWTAYKLLTT